MIPPRSPIRLVCFDIGGVIVRICRTWAEGCAAAGLPVRDPQRWQSAKPARRAIVDEYQRGRIDGRTFAARLSAQVGGLYSPSEILGIHRAWLLGAYQGMAEVVDRLHGQGIRTAALSNTNHEHWTRLGGYPAVTAMRHLLASHQLGLIKPDPAIYHRAESIFGTSGGEILFFDDLLENVEAARSVGWSAEVIDPLGEPAEQVAAVLRANQV